MKGFAGVPIKRTKKESSLARQLRFFPVQEIDAGGRVSASGHFRPPLPQTPHSFFACAPLRLLTFRVRNFDVSPKNLAFPIESPILSRRNLSWDFLKHLKATDSGPTFPKPKSCARASPSTNSCKAIVLSLSVLSVRRPTLLFKPRIKLFEEHIILEPRSFNIHIFNAIE